MAKLQSDDLTLDVKFSSFEDEWIFADEWINYEIKFYWKEDIIINDNILKRDGEWWNNRSFGTFLANDYEKDCLIEIIRNVIDTNRPECWEPIEPDVKIAIYPGRFFPFIKTPYNFFDETEEIRIENEKHEKNQNDLFTIIVFIDSYTFKNSGSYSGEGISLHLIVERKDLEKFVADLQTEYDNLVGEKNEI